MVQAQIDTIADHDVNMKKMLNYYELVDALHDGIDAMRAGADKWLPRFPGEQQDDYKFRLTQTRMTNVFSDITESLASKPFEKDIKVETGSPEWLVDTFQYDVDGNGSNISVFASDMFEAGIRSSIDWVFIDYPATGKTKVSLEEKRKNNYRPFWSRIIAVNVLSIKSRMVGGSERITYFRYKEVEDGKERVRILELDGNVVKWSLHEKGDKYNDETKTYYNQIDEGVMGIDEVPVVPFITGRRIGRTYVTKPALKAAADAQLDLYLEESARKYAKVLAAYPMLSGNGVVPQKDKEGNPIPLGIGPQRVLYAPPGPDGKASGSWSYVEPNANTLMQLSKDIESSIQQLRELGRQPLTAQSENLTVETAAFAAGKAKSSVAAWGAKLRDCLENALRITAKWEMIDVDPKTINVFVFLDFDEPLNEKSVEELGRMRERGDISQETYWREMKRRSVLSDDFDPDTEKTLLLTDTPVTKRNDVISEG